MSEPRTEAGRRLLDDYPARYGGALYTDPVSRQLTEEAIRAIEAEAAAAALARVRDRIDRLWDEHPEECLADSRAYVTLSAVLAVIDESAERAKMEEALG